MSRIALDETQIKELFKQAFVELLQERKDLFYEPVAEIVEELALLARVYKLWAADFHKLLRESRLRRLFGMP